MDRIEITGVPGYDGVYPFDLSHFTNRDFHTIKQISGLRPGEINEAFDVQDNDLIIAFAVIALRRAERPVNVDALWDAEAGNITLIMEDEDDAAPPPQPSSEPPSEPLEQTASSGASGNETGGSPPESNPSGTGIPGFGSAA